MAFNSGVPGKMPKEWAQPSRWGAEREVGGEGEPIKASALIGGQRGGHEYKKGRHFTGAFECP